MAVSPVTWAQAVGIQALIYKLIGERPEIVDYNGQYLEIDFTEQQKDKLISWLDTQVLRPFDRAPQAAPDLQVRIGKVLVPWSVKYLVPIFGGVFLMGMLSNAILFPRKR